MFLVCSFFYFFVFLCFALSVGLYTFVYISAVCVSCSYTKCIHLPICLTVISLSSTGQAIMYVAHIGLCVCLLLFVSLVIASCPHCVSIPICTCLLLSCLALTCIFVTVVLNNHTLAV